MSDTPTPCPNCGHGGAVDGSGEFLKERSIIHADGGVVDYLQTWDQFHCPMCDGTFSILRKEEEVRQR